MIAHTESVNATGTMQISAIRSSPFRREIRVQSPRGEKTLFWEVTDHTRQIGTGDLLDDALVALTPLAQFHRWNMRIDGTVTREQVANMREYQEVWVRLRPDIYSPVDIDYAGLAQPSDIRDPQSGVLAFSGGVDSTFAAMSSISASRGARAISIDFAVLVGGFDIELGDRVATETASVSARNILDEFGIELVAIDTNWRRDFSPNYTMSFGLGLAATLHQFQPVAEAAVIASDLTYAEEIATWGRTSLINHLSGHSGFPFPPTSTTDRRLDKIMAIASIPSVRENIRVCWQPEARGRNCKRCAKCVRTKLGFAAAGYDVTTALGRVDPADLESVHLSMWDAVYLADMLRTPGMLDISLTDAIERRLDRHRSDSQPLSIQNKVPG